MNDLEKKIDRLTERLHRLDFGIKKDALIARLDDLSTDQIATHTSQQAADYLRTVDDSKIGLAYQIFSERIDKDAMMELCLAFLQRPGQKARRTGAFGLGSCLKGTGNIEASHSLALVVRNPVEDPEIRLGAYLSLVVINKDVWMALSGSDFKPEDLNFELRNVDWCFVDRFLER